LKNNKEIKNKINIELKKVKINSKQKSRK